MIGNHKTRRRIAASNVCLQALTLSLPSPRDFFTLSPNKEAVHRQNYYNISNCLSYFFSQGIILITLLPYSYSLIFLVLFLPLYVLDKTLMDKVLPLVISFGLIAGVFLLRTNRVVQAIVLWNECLTFLNNKALEKENDLVREGSMLLYECLCRGYAAIYKLSPAIESGKKTFSPTS